MESKESKQILRFGPSFLRDEKYCKKRVRRKIEKRERIWLNNEVENWCLNEKGNYEERIRDKIRRQSSPFLASGKEAIAVTLWRN